MRGTQMEQRSPMGGETDIGKTRTVNVGRTERNLSMIGGAAMALGGLLTMMRRRFFSGSALLATGSMFLYRGKTGHCNIYNLFGFSTAGTSDTGITMEKTVTINRSPQEVYEFWRDFSNLPRFMNYLDSVNITGPKTSHWKARTPVGLTIEWDAEITEDRPERISWHSLGDADIHNQGSVEFREASGGRGTEMKVTIDYYPPAGGAGKAAAKLLNGITSQQLEEDLKRFKQVVETGETATAKMTGEKGTASGF